MVGIFDPSDATNLRGFNDRRLGPISAAWITALGEHGDYTRTHILDPVMTARIARCGFASALDVGCEEGRFCWIVREHGIATVGIDPTCVLLGRARHLDPVGDYHSSRAEELPFPD
jgi:2-polyprenyl-3-methyl-5-hydroxy-6-metoxy-1,4-benzoquinol methylase